MDVSETLKRFQSLSENLPEGKVTLRYYDNGSLHGRFTSEGDSELKEGNLNDFSFDKPFCHCLSDVKLSKGNFSISLIDEEVLDIFLKVKPYLQEGKLEREVFYELDVLVNCLEQPPFSNHPEKALDVVFMFDLQLPGTSPSELVEKILSFRSEMVKVFGEELIIENILVSSFLNTSGLRPEDSAFTLYKQILPSLVQDAKNNLALVRINKLWDFEQQLNSNDFPWELKYYFEEGIKRRQSIYLIPWPVMNYLQYYATIEPECFLKNISSREVTAETVELMNGLYQNGSHSFKGSLEGVLEAALELQK